MRNATSLDDDRLWRAMKRLIKDKELNRTETMRRARIAAIFALWKSTANGMRWLSLHREALHE